MKQMNVIGIIGAGQMGVGIAQVCATAGFKVWLYDVAPDQLKKALANIEKSLEKLTEKGKLTQAQQDQTIQNLNITHELNDLRECDFCIEAATEKPEIKFKIFKELDSLLKSDCFLASNTSSIPIASLATQTKRPEKVIGMHFMNPVPLMECVEVIPSQKTSSETLKTTLELIKNIGKIPVTVKDSAGFVVNRILLPMLNEAISALEEGLAAKEDIDLAMKLSCHFPMGPLALADFIGLDTCLSILEVIKKKPASLLKRMVSEGKLGKKTGEGFYKYST